MEKLTLVDRLSQLFRSVSDVYTLKSVRRKKLLSMSRDVSAISRNIAAMFINLFLPLLSFPAMSSLLKTILFF